MADKNYITRAGWKRLVDELTHLATVERPKVVREVADAAAEGDRSENSAYIYGKRRLREIDRRMGFLQRRLKDVMVVDHHVDFDVDARSALGAGAVVRPWTHQQQSQRERAVLQDRDGPHLFPLTFTAVKAAG